MATSSTGRGGKAANDPVTGAPGDLEAEVARLKADIATLREQLNTTGEHSIAAARRVATEGAEQLRIKGEAAMDSLKTNADDIERQVTAAVRDKPITSLAIAAGVGFFLALLTRR